MSITLPPPGSSAEHYGYLTVDAALEYAWAYSAAVEADRASRPQTVPDELRAAAAAVVARWNLPKWKEAEHTGVSINRLHAAIQASLRAELEAVEAAPVAQAQEVSAADLDIQRTALRDAIAESLSCTYVCCRVWEAWSYGTMSRDDFVPAGESDEVLESVLAAIESVAPPVAQAQPESAPPAKAPMTVAQFDEMRAYGQQCADAALANHAAQPESAPARVPMTPDEAGQLWRAVHAARSAGGDHHETSYVAFARAVEQRCGIGSTT